ncbi:hypothetical protein Leryth_011988 [Lithospermum erythrorhizon]|nr:hypothetical protein Leryth_011988 [Lithospermum erythrorhizon]
MPFTKGRDEEFQEDDVWGVSKPMEQKLSGFKTLPLKGSSSFTTRPLPSTSRMIPRPSSNIGVQESRIPHHSAPVNVPNWSKIYGSSKTAPSSVEDGGGSYEEEEDEGGCGGGMVPPHVLIDRRLARKQMSFSMCEGVGRTLKGRDLKKVRNDVLAKTGFLE